MFPRRFAALHLALVLTLLPIPINMAPAAPAPSAPPSIPAAHAPLYTYRTTVRSATPPDAARLTDLGVHLLHQGDGTATVLADPDQLAVLVREGFAPRATDDLGNLAATHAGSSPWLAAGVRPLLAQSRVLHDRMETEGAPRLADLAAVDASLRALSPEIRLALATLPSTDDDGDGLTNTQEQWWCTDPADADSDDDNVSDGEEVQRLKDWLTNKRTSAPSSGKPFAGWPPQITGCRDDDHDGVPDLAETLELGLNPNLESTDRDKFDDGQELFGLTYCPGSGGFCGYGVLPRNEDWGVITANMPSWVQAPGKHPFVAAFPVPEIDVVQNSLTVQTVTVVTTDRRVEQNEQRTYSTAKTEGTSSSVADTTTWNNWEETSISKTEVVTNQSAAMPKLQSMVRLFSTQSTPILTGSEIVETGCAIGGGLLGLPFGGVGAAIGAPLGALACKAGINLISAHATAVAPPVSKPLNELGIDPDDPAFDNVKVDLNPTLSGCQAGSLDVLTCQKLVEKLQIANPLPASALPAALGTDFRLADNCAPNSPTPICDGLIRTVTPTQGSQSASVSTQRVFQLSYPTAQLPTVTTGKTKGSSNGGAHTVTHTTYEEQTVTNGQVFGTTEGWGTATAEDSAHSANLRFTYRVSNKGTEYAREIANLTFNIFIGDNPNPVCSYFVGSQECGVPTGSATFQNFMPGEEHTFTSGNIPLSLEEMKAIDLGGPIRIVVEDFTYGIDELFYQDALNAGVVVAIEDGTDDGDELIDSYLIPTWDLPNGKRESVQRVIARYFPHETDAEGNLIAIFTPEPLTSRPSWCVRPSGGAQNDPTNPYDALTSPVWCRHALSSADWWNIYLNNLGDGTASLQETEANPAATAFFRFNKDTDLDGYSDRSERRLGTDPRDPADHPRPELLAGTHCSRTGNDVTCTLSLLNTGPYDAYGVEAVMVAPDDSTTIINNTVGGSGRVRAGRQVIVGSTIKLQEPLAAAWTQPNHAQPAGGGYYTGDEDRTYTFTVQCATSGGCDVGAGEWSLTWQDDTGASGTALNFGAGYESPKLLDVTEGVQVALLSGKVFPGENFTVVARTPRDTFKYTVNRGDETDPLVIVSYNDPQGNHRLVTPVRLDRADADLTGLSGQMLPDPGVEIVTTAAAVTGANSTDLVVNNPTNTTLTDAHLFLEFIDAEGQVALEVPATATLPPGPTVVAVPWNTGDFAPAYQEDQDYIVLAFLTDYQGNILDTAGRPLSSFQPDPKPAFAAADDLTWDFGTARQGTLLQRQFTLASVGFTDLLTHIGTAEGISVTGPSARGLGPGDTGAYTVTINTGALDPAPFEKTIPIRTSDPDHRERTITIRGNIIGADDPLPVNTTLHPLDVSVTVTDGTQGTWTTFDHSLGPDEGSLHPVKVFGPDGAFKGVGKTATPFGQGTASADLFGDGRDGDKTVTGTEDLNPVRATASGNVGSTNLAIAGVTGTRGFQENDQVLIYQTRGSNVGKWELNAVQSLAGGQLTLKRGLTNTYTTDGGANRAQALWVPQYHDLTVSAGGIVSPTAWDGSTGGIVVVQVAGKLTVQPGTQSGRIDVSGKGYRGGQGGQFSPNHPGGGYGESYGAGPQSARNEGDVNSVANGGGGVGGLGRYGGGEAQGGGGASYGTQGIRGGNETFQGAPAGLTYGQADLSVIYFGSGGGGGGKAPHNTNNSPGGNGGNGGGIIMAFARRFDSSLGDLYARGSSGGDATRTTDESGGGGGGSGGSIFVRSGKADFGAATIAEGGGRGTGSRPDGRENGGIGGDGRIRIETCDTPPVALTRPLPSTQKLDCYIVEQLEGDPTKGRLNVPDTFTGTRTYRVRYGRLLPFGAAPSPQVTSVRVQSEAYAAASLDVLVSNTGVPSGPLTISLDIGNDGTVDWTYNETVNFPAELPASGLAAALNQYFVSQEAEPGASVDVPITVEVNRQADVFLTNMVLGFQAPAASVRTQAVNLGADRPLDLPVPITGDRTQGDTYEFPHTISPNPATVHPCKVYDDGGTVLKGVGRYCAEFSEGTAAADMFGDGRDGDKEFSTNAEVNTHRTTASGTQGSSVVNVGSSGAFLPGELWLIHQTRGTNAGQWELHHIQSVAPGQVTLRRPLAHTYVTDGGANRAQMVWVPQYRNVTINAGVTVSPPAWDGNIGGIFSFIANGTVAVNGTISTMNDGYRGGNTVSDRQSGIQGEGTVGTGTASHNANGNGGGGGQIGSGEGPNGAFEGSGGGGGGNGDSGRIGQSNDPNPPDITLPGMGGSTSGSTDLTTLTFGGGGGSGGGISHAGYSRGFRGTGGAGGNGGGVIIVFGAMTTVAGTITADGSNGTVGTGGFGSGGGGSGGGSILVKTQEANFGDNLITAKAGNGALGQAGITPPNGGNGGVGRIRIEYCDSLTGSTVPATVPAKINQCFIADQKAGDPTWTVLTIPESFTGGRTYQVQYGRHYAFAGEGTDTQHVRVTRQVYGSASLDLLVSGTGSDPVNVALYVGSSATPALQQTVTSLPAKLEAPDVTDAVNAYVIGRPETVVEVPFRVEVDRGADVMLTNLSLTPSGAVTRYLRLPARTYDTLTLDLTFGEPGQESGPLAFTVDVGADGSIDWSATRTYPTTATTRDLAEEFNAFLAGKSGEPDVPIRILPSPSLTTSLTGFTATTAARPDLTLTTADISFSPESLTEGEETTVTATLHNSGALASSPLTVSFFATPPAGSGGSAPVYIGSTFVPNVPAGGTAPAVLPWNTLGFPGANVTVHVLADPCNRVLEAGETANTGPCASGQANNSASRGLPILTRPDLAVVDILLSDPAPVADQDVTVTLRLRNRGQTAAGTSLLALYDENPDSGGTLVDQRLASVAGGQDVTETFTWRPVAPGRYRLFAVADDPSRGAVNESDEGNNRTWREVSVGLKGPLHLDSGATNSPHPDRAYDEDTGYGFRDEGQPDVLATCPTGSDAERTLRRDPGSTSAGLPARVLYQFDHLVAGRFYHLDLVLLECDGLRRQQTVRVDGLAVGDPVDLGDGQPHRLSLLLDPALYAADQTVVVGVEAPALAGAVVSEISLHDVDFRYADAGYFDAVAQSGAARDPQYPGSKGYGWLDGTHNLASGSLPYQSARVDQTDNTLRYRFDGLVATKRYHAHLTFWQKPEAGAATAIQTVQLDSTDTGRTVVVEPGAERQTLTIAVPPAAYQADGRVDVQVTRVNASAGAFVNEIALEEETVGLSAGCVAPVTPSFTEVFGVLSINGQPAAVGTVVQAISPRGDTVGCFTVTTAGQFGFLRVYGEDATASPPIPGMRAGEHVVFQVNGVPAAANPRLAWQDDRTAHSVGLTAGVVRGQPVFLNPGWNLLSLQVEPLASRLTQALNPLRGRYDRVLGENTIYATALPEANNTLKEIHSRKAYYLRLTGLTTLDALLEGQSVAVTTPMTLGKGWNWVGYLPDVPLPVATALQSIQGKYQRVLSLNQTYDTRFPGFNTLHELRPSAGYLIYMTDAGSLVYPSDPPPAALRKGGPVPDAACGAVGPTPLLTLVFGEVSVNGAPAPMGTSVEALTPRGAAAGCFVVDREGFFGMMHVYGEDASALPPIAGFRAGEAVGWRVNGLPATAVAALAWHDDRTPHALTLDLAVQP